jgi:hypothetical protein
MAFLVPLLLMAATLGLARIERRSRTVPGGPPSERHAAVIPPG